MLQYMKEDKINMVKNVIYVLYDLYNSNFQFLLQNVSREYLINLYFIFYNSLHALAKVFPNS